MSDGTIWAFNRDREIASLNDSKSATTVLNALTASCAEVVQAAQAKGKFLKSPDLGQRLSLTYLMKLVLLVTV